MTAYTRGHTLTGLADMARITMTLLPAHGDLDSSKQASGAVGPGELVEPVSAVGAGAHQAAGTPQGRVAKVGGTLSSASMYGGMKRYGIAMRVIEHSTTFSDPNDTNTNIAQSNKAIADGEYVRVAKSGVFLTTLVETGASASMAATFLPGTPLTWDGAATRSTGLTGTGAWTPATASDLVLAEVKSFKAVGDGGLLELKLLA